MFFFLSKTLSLLLMPLSLIITGFVLSLLIRRPKLKRIFFWIAFGMLLFFSNDFICNEVISAWELPAKPFTEMRPYKLGIVLTGTTITKPYPDDRVYFSRGADRVTHTIQLYKQGLIEKILISGGTGTLTNVDEPEANKYKKVMLLMGVDSADILIENETRNTYESAVAVRPMLDSLGYTATDCVLITSAFHMRRSLACYHKAGLDIDYFTGDFYSHERNFYVSTLLVPSIESLSIWQKLFKEWIGFAAYKAAGYV